MECARCGATLKPTAVFCHRCGLRLAPKPAAMAEAPVEPAPEPPSAPSDDNATQPVQQLPELSAEAALDLLTAAETRELPLGVVTVGRMHAAPPKIGDVIGERYRVERLLDEEVFEVVDLWAQDRCWSCGTPWNDDDDDRFCEHCGAERRGKLLSLRALTLTPALLAVSANDPQAIVNGDAIYLIAAPDATDSAPATEQLPAAAAPPAATPEPESDPVLAVEAVDPNAATMLLDVGAAVPGPNDAPTVEDPFLVEQPSLRSTPEVRMGLASDRGRARRQRANEDSACAIELAFAGEDPPPPLVLCLVADGLGGHEDGLRAGRVAARAVASSVVARLWLPALAGFETEASDPIGLGDVLRDAILAANRAVIEINQREGADMGCTVTALLLQGDAACVANVGDSRTYRYAGGAIECITKDHSLVARLVANGMLAPEGIYTHPQRSQVFRSLGDEDDLIVDLFPLRVSTGDTFVLCSDGLWEMVHDPELAHAIETFPEQDTQLLAEHLIHLANDRGGEDNVTAIVAQVVS
jgi:serine/threonine protein phosphatase PrpC